MKHNRIRALALALAILVASSVPASVWADGGADSGSYVSAVRSGNEGDSNDVGSGNGGSDGSDSGTQAPGSEPTSAPETQPSTQAPETQPSTQAPETQPSTQAPETQPSTQAPETQPSTQAPETQPSTDAPETKPSETQPTEAPDESECQQETQSSETTTSESKPAVSGEDATEIVKETTAAPETTEPYKVVTASKESIETVIATSSAAETTSGAAVESLAGVDPALLIVHDYIIEPELIEDFRFQKIDRVPAILDHGAKIYTEAKKGADVVGVADGTALVYVIDKSKEWAFVESDYVRGFARRKNLTLGDEAEHVMTVRDKWFTEHNVWEPKPFGTVIEKMAHTDNPAFTFTKTTTMEVQAEKVYAIALEDLHVYDNRAAAVLNSDDTPNTTVLGALAKGGLAYVLVDDGGESVFIESADVRGFVNRNLLLTGEEADKQVQEKEEGKFTTAQQRVEPEENPVLYYTIQSVEKPGDAVRTALIKFALQFVGNPYVWGGTSLTHGTDCSGFTQSVYAHFGYHIPRTSGPQANYGVNMGIKPENAKPGDIVCYKGHVALYMGDGKIVHASNSKQYPSGGIKVSSVNIRPIIAIRRIIP